MNREKKVRLICWIICEVLAVGTVVCLLSGGMNEGLLLALATPFMLLLPTIAEKLFRCKVSLPIFIFGLVYAMGPMLGQCWKLYYLTNWWDKALHISGGVMFALVGWFVCQKLTGDTQKKVIAALFALCFSVALAAVWEFIEFGADQLCGMDMQNDRIITHIVSYDLGPAPGVLGSIDSIGQVSIDGVSLPFAGYLDIGLHDSMWDMILESLGALITAIICYFSKNNHLGFIPEES